MRQKSMTLTITQITLLAVLVIAPFRFDLLGVPAGAPQISDVVDDVSHRTEFSSAGVTFFVKSTADQEDSFQLRYRSAAVGDSVRSFEGGEATAPVYEETEVVYARSGGVIEKYRTVHRGIEQIIIFEGNFIGSGDLVITADLATPAGWALGPIETIGALTFYSGGEAALNIGPVIVTDAAGRESEVRAKLDETRLTLIIEDAWMKDAAYPLQVRSSIVAIDTVATDTTAPKLSGEGKSLGVQEATMMAATTLYSIEDTPVWRVQLRLVTSDFSSEAATINPVEVKLNADNSTYLDGESGGSDFHKGAYRTYDLITDKVAKLRDIQFLYISKVGNDPWYIKSLTLYVNGVAVYGADFYGSGLMLGVNGAHMVFPHVLRNHTLWQAYMVPALPRQIPAAELEKRIEAHIGDYLNEMYWYGPWAPSVLQWADPEVWAWGGSGTKVDVNLYLRTISGREVDISLDLEFSCGSGKLFLATRNLRIFNYPVVDSVSAANTTNLQMLLQIVIPIKIQSDFQKVTYTNTLGQPACPIIFVDRGSVLLNY